MKCNKLKVKCGYRNAKNECVPKSRFDLFECLEMTLKKRKLDLLRLEKGC